MPDAFCFHCNNNQAIALIQFKQVHKQTYTNPLSCRFHGKKNTNEMMIVDVEINEMKIEHFQIVRGSVADIMWNFIIQLRYNSMNGLFKKK